MDIGSLIAAALLSLGLIGTDAVLNAGNVVFQVSVTKKLAERGYTPQVVDTLLDDDLKEIVEFKSIVHQTRIRSADQKSIVGSIAEAMNLRDVTGAFQAEFGLDSIRLTGSLMDGETGEFRFLLGGESLHTGKFIIDITSEPRQSLPDFLAEAATQIAARLEPYAVAIEKFKVLQRKNKYVDDDADHTAFQEFIAQQMTLTLDAVNNEDNRAVLYNLLGMSSLLYHEHECSKQQFEQAAKIDPELGVPLLNLAVLALTERRFDDAIHLAGMAQNASDMGRVAFLVANTHVVIGLALWGKNDLAGAAQQFHGAITIYPGSMWAYYYWSMLETSLDNKDSAAVLLARAEYNLQIFESYPEVALMYIKLDPVANFAFSRVDILHARRLSDLAPLKQETAAAPSTGTAAKPANCAL